MDCGAVDDGVGVRGADQDGNAQLPLVSNLRMHDGFPEQLGSMFQDGVDTDQLGRTSLNTEPILMYPPLFLYKTFQSAIPETNKISCHSENFFL